ncbi:ATP-binding protein [Catellatospora chokoriensis]|uniref:NB-ARC domain-containing protein n=1 Tax=Catellatospora chokoriensis TaxID=310353 RepID=A0A8J3K550_9ACTN|nr:tetratricopeptide repeat protein [Catellatospora chokoriensis]GIF90840.1 hypothetical protein Cch02nite_42840 [Catellatospora chokoriensis]
MTEDRVPESAPNVIKVTFESSRHDGKGDVNQAGRDLVQNIYTRAGESLPVPRQLPSGAGDFVDREEHLARLNFLLSSDRRGGTRAVAVVGTAGVGKTALALQWANGTRDGYADGDLYVNLRGYDSEGPADPSDVLDGFLRAFDIPPDKVPAGPDARAGLYRAVLATRRVLIVLDNAATAGQVRPLLPGSGSCAVLITSRSRLAGLSIRDGVASVDLELLPADEAVLLLTKLIGRQAETEVDETAELARLCAYLPLALRIVAERARSRPYTRIRDVVAELRASSDRLDLLAVEDDELTSVRAVFSWSYDNLPPAVARMFRMLGLHLGPDVSASAAAALADTTVTDARQRLDALFGVHLVDSVERDRYQLHDLLKVYAAELAQRDCSADEVAAAQRRELTWYLHAASHADLLLNPGRRRVVPDVLEGPWSPSPFANRDDALQWCEAERLNCVAMVRHAAAIGFHDIAWKLPLLFNTFFYVRWYVANWIETATIGVASARVLQDPFAEAWSLIGLGGAREIALDWAQALQCYEEALGLWRTCGDQRGEMLALHNLGNAYREVGRLVESLAFEAAGLAIAEHVGDDKIAGASLQGQGKTYRAMSKVDEAILCFQRALVLHRQVGDQHTEGQTLCFLADVYRQVGRDSEAVVTYQVALGVQQAIGDQRGQADTLMGLGAAELNSGHRAEAGAAWRSARDIFVVINEVVLRDRAESTLRDAGLA